MAYWQFSTEAPCGNEVHGDVLLPEDGDGYCRMKIGHVAGEFQQMGYVARPDWGRFTHPAEVERFLVRRGWVLDRS